MTGGLGSRLGGAKKALLEVGGRPLVERVLDAVRPLSRDLILVDNDDSLVDLEGVRLIPDIEPRAGPLMGLYSGLSEATTELCIALACDMPFLSTSLLKRLVELIPGFDAAVPVVGGRMHPLHAVYRREPCHRAVGRALDRGEARMVSWPSTVRLREVQEAELRALDPDLRSLFNVNTAKDLGQAKALAAGLTQGPVD